MPDPPRTERSRQEPFAVRFSIFLANRVGRPRELLGLFAAEDLADPA